MKQSILELIESCSDSVLTIDEANSLRGWMVGNVSTLSKTDENSDSNGDGIADDCHEESDDTTVIKDTVPAVKDTVHTVG